MNHLLICKYYKTYLNYKRSANKDMFLGFKNGKVEPFCKCKTSKTTFNDDKKLKCNAFNNYHYDVELCLNKE